MLLRQLLKSLRHSLTASLLLTPISLSAGDWPQILGPDRDGVATNERLHAAWGNRGPKKLWESPVGDGFAGVAVAADHSDLQLQSL